MSKRFACPSAHTLHLNQTSIKQDGFYSGHPQYLVDLRSNSPAAWEAAHGLGYTSPDITPPRTPSPKGGRPTKGHKDKSLSVPGTEIIYFGRTALSAIRLGAAPRPPADSDYLLARYDFIDAPSSPAIPAPSSPKWSETSPGDSNDFDKSDSAISALSSDLASLNLDASDNLAANEAAMTPVTPKQRIDTCLTDSSPTPAPIRPDAKLFATLEEISALVASDDDGSKTPPKKEEETSSGVLSGGISGTLRRRLPRHELSIRSAIHHETPRNCRR